MTSFALSKVPRNKLVDLENLSEEELRKLEDQFQRLRKKAEHDETHHPDGAAREST
jgi:hypothetical protein